METVKIQIATVGADQAAKQTKTLREQIKDLRNELAGLTEGTDEYNAKVKELGDLMHQQSEITNQARMATEDYGQTLSNITRISAGVVGAFTAIQGAMNLLGTENEDAQEAIKTMTSLMGIIQGLTAIDQASKAFQGLVTRIKLATTNTREHTQSLQQNSTAAKTDAANLTTAATATTAQSVAAGTATKMTNGLSLGFKKLGLSIKSFMMSNPFTLIILGATALISVITTLINKTKEEKEALKELAREAELNDIKNSVTYGTGEMEDAKRRRGRGYAEGSIITGYAFQNNNQIKKELENQEALLSMLKRKTEQGEWISPGYLEELEKITGGETDLLAIEKALVNVRRDLNAINLKNKDAELANTQSRLDAELAKKEKDQDEKEIEHLKTLKNELENDIKDKENALADLQTWENEIYKKRKAEKDKQQQDEDNEAKERKQKQLNDLKDQLSLELLMNERAYKANEISLEEYNDKAIEIRNNYLERLKKWIKRWGENEKDYKLTIEQTNDQIIASERATLEEMLRIRELENDPTNAINTRNAQQSVEQAKQAAEARKKSEDAILAQSVEYTEKANELYNASMLRKMILIDKWGKAELDAQHQIEMELLNEQMEAQRGQEQQLEQTYQQQIADQEAITQAKSDALDEQYTNGLMSEQAYLEAIEQLWNEHYQKLDEMEAEHITNTAEIQEEQANTMLEIQQKEFDYEKAKWEERKTLVQNYYSAFTQIVGGIQGLLTELQGAYKEDSKEYENIAEANIIISGITGALEAFQSAMSLGFPYNLIVGGIMSGISIATTTAALNNLKSKKLSSSAQKASISMSPYETISTETGANIEGSISDTRVTVLESDIAETTDRVNVAEQEAQF